MQVRSNTEFNSRRRLITLATCLPSQNELAFDRQRTSHVSWIKRYYFFILGFLFFFAFLSNHYFSWDYLFITLFVRWHKNNNSKNKKKEKKKKKEIFITFFKKYFIWNFLFLAFFSKSLFILMFSYFIFGYVYTSYKSECLQSTKLKTRTHSQIQYDLS